MTTTLPTRILRHNNSGNLSLETKLPNGVVIVTDLFRNDATAIRQAYHLMPAAPAQQTYETHEVIAIKRKTAAEQAQTQEQP